MRWEAARTSLSSGTRHRRCRCCLPALTGFTTGRRGETDAGHHDRENRRSYHMPSARPLTGPGAGICPRRAAETGKSLWRRGGIADDPFLNSGGEGGITRRFAPRPVRGPREISHLAGRLSACLSAASEISWGARGAACGRYPRFVATAISGPRPTRFYTASGGEGGIRTHEHPLRCYWNSSPAPSTARPPLRSITYDSPARTYRG